MKRRNLTPQQNVENIDFCPNLGLHHVILRESSPVDEFYFEKHSPSDDNIESESLVDPIIILFNQQRLDDMGTLGAKEFLDSFNQKSNSLDELRKQCSDDELMSMIKSRHLQSPAEVLAWCRYMQSNVDEFNSAIKEHINQQAVTAESDNVQNLQNNVSNNT